MYFKKFNLLTYSLIVLRNLAVGNCHAFLQQRGAVQGEPDGGVQLQLPVHGDGHGAGVRQQRPHLLLAVPRRLRRLLLTLQLY